MKIQESSIILDNLRFHAFHGVLEQERTVGNDYVVNLRIAYDIEQAMKSDDVKDTLNYAEVYQMVKEEMAVPSALIEHVAGRIGRCLLTHFPDIPKLTLQIVKTNPPMGADCDGAGVEVTFVNESRDIHLINNKTLR